MDTIFRVENAYKSSFCFYYVGGDIFQFEFCRQSDNLRVFVHINLFVEELDNIIDKIKAVGEKKPYIRTFLRRGYGFDALSVKYNFDANNDTEIVLTFASPNAGVFEVSMLPEEYETFIKLAERYIADFFYTEECPRG